MERDCAAAASHIEKRLHDMKDDHAQTFDQLCAVQQREREVTLSVIFQKSNQQRGQVRPVRPNELSTIKVEERSFER
jgi:hypothetical protein